MQTRGRPFTQKYENQVTEMKRLFLDFMKSLRVRAEETLDPRVGTDPGPGPGDSGTQNDDEIKVTPAGYPIIPDCINENLSKARCEKLLRAFLVHHYCELGYSFGSMY
jgi:hypothetical protein